MHLGAAAKRFQTTTRDSHKIEGEVKGREQRKGPGHQFYGIALVVADAFRMRGEPSQRHRR